MNHTPELSKHDDQVFSTPFKHPIEPLEVRHLDHTLEQPLRGDQPRPESREQHVLQHPTHLFPPYFQLGLQLRIIVRSSSSSFSPCPGAVTHGQLLRRVEARQLAQEGVEAGFLVDPVDAGPQAHQEARELGQARAVAPEQEREAGDVPGGGDVEVEVLQEHLAAGDELIRDQVRDLGPGHVGVFGVAEGLFVPDADGDEGSDVERGFESDGAEVPEVGEAQLVEEFVRDHAVVDEVELDAALDGDYSTVEIHDADVRVGREGGCQCRVHGVTD